MEAEEALQGTIMVDDIRIQVQCLHTWEWMGAGGKDIHTVLTWALIEWVVQECHLHLAPGHCVDQDQGEKDEVQAGQD